MDVTKVTLRQVSMKKVCAIASIVIDEQFVVHDLRVVNGDKGLFVAMPSRKLPELGFAIDRHAARNQIQAAVLDQFEEEGGLAVFAEQSA
jgi:stage V sporulation protein G